MMWEKIIPVILFLILVSSVVSDAWQGPAALHVLNIDAQLPLSVNLKSDANLLELNEIRIDIKPLMPVSHSIEALVRCQQKSLKSA